MSIRHAADRTDSSREARIARKVRRKARRAATPKGDARPQRRPVRARNLARRAVRDGDITDHGIWRRTVGIVVSPLGHPTHQIWKMTHVSAATLACTRIENGLSLLGSLKAQGYKLAVDPQWS
jgi:hypothetical protein